MRRNLSSVKIICVDRRLPLALIDEVAQGDAAAHDEGIGADREQLGDAADVNVLVVRAIIVNALSCVKNVNCI